jgi:hypothetical protein
LLIGLHGIRRAITISHRIINQIHSHPVSIISQSNLTIYPFHPI